MAADLVRADNVRMPKLGGGAGFAHEFLDGGGVELFPARNLQRHGPVEHRVASLPDRPELPHPETLNQLEVRNLRERGCVARVFGIVDEAKAAPAGRAVDVDERGIDDQVDRAMAVRTANDQAAGFFRAA